MSASVKHRRLAADDRILGFWIYLTTDTVLFGALFACFAVFGRRFAGGPTGRDLFHLPTLAIETALLLTSSFTVGLATLALRANRTRLLVSALVATAVFGAGFIAIEVRDFVTMIAAGAEPSRSAFLSSFFALVGTHGLHVCVGLIWIGVLIAQLPSSGGPIDWELRNRLLRFSLFWHFLDVVWVAVFTFVYLLGVQV